MKEHWVVQFETSSIPKFSHIYFVMYEDLEAHAILLADDLHQAIDKWIFSSSDSKVTLKLNVCPEVGDPLDPLISSQVT